MFILTADNSFVLYVNDQYAGELIDRPFRLDVTWHRKHAANTNKIEPFAPKSVRLVILGNDES